MARTFHVELLEEIRHYYEVEADTEKQAEQIVEDRFGNDVEPFDSVPEEEIVAVYPVEQESPTTECKIDVSKRGEES